MLLALNLLTPGLLLEASAQTKAPTTSTTASSSASADPSLSSGAAATQNTDKDYGNAKQSYDTLVRQAAEQGEQQTIQNTNQQLLQGTELGAYNDTYAGITKFWGDDIIGNLFQNIGQLIGRWLVEFVDGWVSQTVHFLAGYLRTFVLNPNVAVNGIQNGPGAGTDDISPYVREGADTMYGIAVDLLLLLFILCIWKYWAEAAWRGGSGLLGAVGRLIFTAGLMLAWPTIYAFEIQITNEMINAIFFNSADQVAMLDAALATAVRAGLVASTAVLANAFAPIVGAAAGGAAGGTAGGIAAGTIGDVVAFAGLIIYLFLGVVLIAEMIYIIVLKAIQTALLTAQYMFAPIFIVFFATPDTENVTSGYVRSFVEVSLWTFVWVGLLKIMVIILYSDFNPWGKIIMAVGTLQIMIQVPSFLARAQISPMSDFISAGMLTGGLMKGMGALSGMVSQRGMQAVDYFNNQKLSSTGLKQSKTTSASGAGPSNPELVNGLSTAGQQKPGDGKPGDHSSIKGANGEVTPPSMKNSLAEAGAGAAAVAAPKAKTNNTMAGKAAAAGLAAGVVGGAALAGMEANKAGQQASTDAEKAKEMNALNEPPKSDAEKKKEEKAAARAEIDKLAREQGLAMGATTGAQGTGGGTGTAAGNAAAATADKKINTQQSGQTAPAAAMTPMQRAAAAAAAGKNAGGNLTDQNAKGELKVPGAEIATDDPNAAIAAALGAGTATQDITAKTTKPTAAAQATPQGLNSTDKPLNAGGNPSAKAGDPEVKATVKGEIATAAAALATAAGLSNKGTATPPLPKLGGNDGKPLNQTGPNSHQNSEVEVGGPETVSAIRGDGEQQNIRMRQQGTDARSLSSEAMRGGQVPAAAAAMATGIAAGGAVAAALNAVAPKLPLAMSAANHSAAVKQGAAQALNPIVQQQGTLPDQTMAAGVENPQAILNQTGAHNVTNGQLTNTLGINATPTNTAAPNNAAQHQQANLNVQGQVIPKLKRWHRRHCRIAWSCCSDGCS